MKIRTDYVSNSSSSSFIFYNTNFIENFKITKADIFDALVELYGKDKYQKWLDARTDEGIKKAVDEWLAKNPGDKSWYPQHLDSEWYHNERPFYVYDLSTEQEIVKEKWGNLLQGWDRILPGTEYDFEVENCHKFDSFLAAVNEAYSCWLHQGTDKELSDPDKKLPEDVKNVVKTVRKKLEIKTNLEVALDPESRFFIHFEDNLMSELEGFDEYGPKDLVGDGNYVDWLKKDYPDAANKKWTTEANSTARFMEILLNKLIEMKKIDVKDVELRKLYKGNFNKQWQEANPEIISWLENDEYNVNDFIKETIATFNPHEG